MLRIYSDVLDWLEMLETPKQQIARRDRNLSDQLSCSSTSVALNMSEGMVACGRQRTACYRISLREMRESYTALEIAQRLRFIAALEPALEDRSQKILGTLVRLAYPRR
jgi:four helix bundle protein